MDKTRRGPKPPRPNEGYRDPKRRFVLRSASDLGPDYDPPPHGFVATSISSEVLRYGHIIRRTARMGAVAGPPGIGKTEAVKELKRSEPEFTFTMKIRPRCGTMSHVRRGLCEALARGLEYERGYFVPAGDFETRNYLKNIICDRLGLSIRAASSGRYDKRALPRFTLVADEAQNLERDGMEFFRYCNDPTDCFSFVPLGILIVGNNELSLKPDRFGKSVLSSAMADRLIFNETFEYEDVSDDDIALIADAIHEITDDAQALLCATLGGGVNRTLRTVVDAMALAKGAVGDASVGVTELKAALDEMTAFQRIQQWTPGNRRI